METVFLLVATDGRPATWLRLGAGNVGGGGNHAGRGGQVAG